MTKDHQQRVGPLGVAIIENMDEIREGLADLIDSADGFACVGVWRAMEPALAALRTIQPDVLLCDLGLPGMGPQRMQLWGSYPLSGDRDRLGSFHTFRA